MATINLTAHFSNLSFWPGRLLEDPGATVIVTQTATDFRFRYTTGDFANYRIVVTGTGFTYVDGVPTGGTMTSVRILNPAGQTVISFNGLAAGTLASDLSQFHGSVFGTQSGEGPGPQGWIAWAHLMSGNDIINGTAGDDRQGLVGIDLGNDTYNMGAGDDHIYGGSGNDTINGDAGWDRLSFGETSWQDGASAFRGANVNLATGVVLDPWGGTDAITGIEEVQGSRFNDVITGNAARNEFIGLRGADTFRGGGEEDRLRYDDDYWLGGNRGIIVDLETALVGGSIRGTIRDGFGNIDTVFDIESVTGTRFNDVFVGSSASNVFFGGEGVDSYVGEGGVKDEVSLNVWFGDTQPGNIRVDFRLASGQIINDGFGNTETMVGIEAIDSGPGNDTLIGNASANELRGDLGTDLMTGGGGNDTFEFLEGSGLGQGDRITDFLASGVAANIDVLAFRVSEYTGLTGTLRLVNGTAATQAGGTFVYNAANDTLFWDQDGTGAAAMVAVVILSNVAALSAANFELYF